MWIPEDATEISILNMICHKIYQEYFRMDGKREAIYISGINSCWHVAWR